MGVNDLEQTSSAEEQSQTPNPEPQGDSGAMEDPGETRGEEEQSQATETPAAAPEDQGEPAPNAEDADKPPVKYARFKTVYGRMKHLERENERLNQAKGPPDQEQDRQQEPTTAPPKEDDFETYEQYIDARSDWRYDNRAALDKQRNADQQAKERLSSKLTEGVAKIPDFNEKAYLPEALVGVVSRNSEDPADLAYYWGEHPEEALALLDLSSDQQAAAIVRTEAKLKAERPTPKTQPTTQFPHLKTVDGVREGSDEKPIEQMSTEEYIAYQNKQEGIAYHSD